MSTQKWEYCTLERTSFNVEMDERGPEGEQFIATLVTRFYSSNQEPIFHLLKNITTKNIGELRDKDLFGKALGLLGNGGWELVSLFESRMNADISTVFTAYFKRIIMEGRAADEPRFELTEPAFEEKMN